MSQVRQESSRRRGKNTEPTQIGVPDGTEVILVDASWEGSNRAGWGAVCFNDRRELHGIRFGAIRARSVTRRGAGNAESSRIGTRLVPREEWCSDHNHVRLSDTNKCYL